MHDARTDGRGHRDLGRPDPAAGIEHLGARSDVLASTSNELPAPYRLHHDAFLRHGFGGPET